MERKIHPLRADLHTHTFYSDGKHSPAQIARKARENGVALLSMTDHDTMEGLEEKCAAAKAEGLFYVPGWEVSAYTDIRIHVLGYNCEMGEAYHNFVEERRRCARLRAEEILEKANAYLGTHVTMHDVEQERAVPTSLVHTMHIVRAVARALNVKRGQLYDELFDVGKPAYSDFGRPTPYDALEVIHACGGLAVLAHPGRIQMPFEEREAFMNDLVSRGLDGIECRHSQHTVEDTEYLLRYAKAHGLLKTGGSDYHQEESVRSVGQPEFYPDGELLEALGLRI